MTVTNIIICITIGASFIAWNRHDLYEKWMMTPYKIKRNNEFYRFITSGFIHSGYAHLGFNMFAFYGFSKLVEAEFGPVKFAILYLVGLIVSDLPTYFKYKDSPSYHSLGASGAVSSVIFACILLNPLGQVWMVIWIDGFIFAALYLIYSYYQAKNSSDNINHDAHFYGAVFGIIYTIALVPNILSRFFDQISQWNLFQ